MFGQTFQPHDLLIIALLIVLEGVLSIDNALVLGLLARPLPRFLQRRALMYGLVGALTFRLLAIGLAGFLLAWRWPKLIGGLYLLFVAVKHFFIDRHKPGKLVLDDQGVPHHVDPETGNFLSPEQELDASEARPLVGIDYAHANSTHTRAFWGAVLAIELTDIAFAVDSILAAIGTVPGREKLWIVVIGGMIGVALMRFAASFFIRLLDRFPRFEVSAYLLVIVIGLKLITDYFFPGVNFHHPGEPAFWIFWITMVVCFGFGFLPTREIATVQSVHPR